MIYNKLVATPIFYQCVGKGHSYFANGAYCSNNEIFSWTIYTEVRLRSAENHNVETASMTDTCGTCCAEAPGVFSTQPVKVEWRTASVYFGIIYV